MNIFIPNLTYITGFSVVKSLKSAHHNIYGTIKPFIRGKLLQNDFFDQLIYGKMMSLYGDVFNISLPTLPAGEMEYLYKILEICEQKNIDVIFPISDKEITFFARHREVFVKRNIAVATNGYQTLQTAFNKYEVSEIADEIGYPRPQTIKCASVEEAIRAGCALDYPLILKPYISAGGSYDVMFIQTQQQLLEEFQEKIQKDKNIILQEYIKGSRERSLNIVLDSQQKVLLAFTLRKMRHIKPSLSTAIEVVENPPEMDKVIELVQRLGIVGFRAVQTKLDEKDGKYKLIEVNPRLGSNARILARMGNDLPLINLNLFLNQALPDINPYVVGTKGCAPFDDFLAFFVFLYVKFKNRNDLAKLNIKGNNIPSVYEMLRSYFRDYTGRPVLDDYAVSIFDKPLSTLRFYRWLFKAIHSAPTHFDEFIPWGDI